MEEEMETDYIMEEIMMKEGMVMGEEMGKETKQDFVSIGIEVTASLDLSATISMRSPPGASSKKDVTEKKSVVSSTRTNLETIITMIVF